MDVFLGKAEKPLGRRVIAVAEPSNLRFTPKVHVVYYEI